MNRASSALASSLACAFFLASAAAEAASPTTASDKIVTIAGARYYQTAYDGKLRPLPPIDRTLTTAAMRNAPVAPLPTGLPLPSRVMLDEEGYVTPVKDQGGRGSCTIFSSVGAIESEYRRQLGLTLDLSEEYLINMINDGRAPNWVGGEVTEKLLVASLYGLPPTTDVPYIADDSVTTHELDQVFGVVPGSSAETTLLGDVWTVPLMRDIANYNTLVYPAAQAHADAIYGPAPDAISAVQASYMDPTPYETLLAAGHAISFETAVGAWEWVSAGTLGYNPNGDQTIDHAILLVGYDHAKQIFRIKNSWGAGWNGNGYADFTYELFLKTVTSPHYVTALRSPSTPTGGNGIARGFWNVVLDGDPGVVIIQRAYSDAISSAPAGYFYGDDGVTAPLDWISGDATHAVLARSGGDRIQTIHLTAGANGWTYLGNGSDDAGSIYTARGVWCRTAPAATANLSPATYVQTTADPYVFPTGTCSPGETITHRVIKPSCPEGCRCSGGKVILGSCS